jgi:hypothetical protein
MNGNNVNAASIEPAEAHVRQVVRSAETELRQLLGQRVAIMKRIGTIKQTLAGLANLFGDAVLTDELLTLIGRGVARRRPGLTRACRLVLMDSPQPLSSRQVCDHLQRRFPELLERHKDPLASVNTILGRLVDYAEVRSYLREGGGRVWQWTADDDSAVESLLAGRAEVSTQ